MTTTELTFPLGVRYGKPFLSTAAAAAWMIECVAGKHGDICRYVYGSRSFDWSVAPVYWPAREVLLAPFDTASESFIITDPLDPTETMYLDVTDLADAWASTSAPTGIHRTHIIIPDDSFPDQRVFPGAAVLGLYRHVLGLEYARRQILKESPREGRGPLAKQLRAVEDLAVDIDAWALASINLWVSTAWADALSARGTSVIPDPNATTPERTGLFDLQIAN